MLHYIKRIKKKIVLKENISRMKALYVYSRIQTEETNTNNIKNKTAARKASCSIVKLGTFKERSNAYDKSLLY